MRVLDLIYPSKCVFCGSILGRDENGACRECEKQLPYVTEPVCVRCGKPVADPEEPLCLDCSRRKDTALSQSAALWIYREDTRRAMLDFKYGGCRTDASYYGKAVLQRLRKRILTWSPDTIVPIPIHRRRERYRGYNQAELLANELGAGLGLPVEPLLRRTRYTVPQKDLSPGERRANLRQAFSVDEELMDPDRHRRLLLVDDIYTTGATLESCAGLLRDAGAGEVYAICLCIGSDS
ncbi:MAG: ComF family protein [Eubacterium sp.]|nr:ComF family protein [Eubacterium sp.]